MRAVEVSRPSEIRGFGTSLTLEISAAELKLALDDTALRMAQKVLPPLAAFFAVLFFFREVQILAATHPGVHIATATAAFLLTVIALAVHRHVPWTPPGNLAITSAAGVALLHTFLEMGLTSRVDSTLYVIVLLPGLAASVVSWYSFLSVLGTAVLGWSLLAWHVLPPAESQLTEIFGVCLAATTIFSTALLWYRLRAYRSRLQDHLASEKRTQALQQIQCRYESAVRGANDGLWFWDLTTNAITVSARWLEMIGCAANSFTIEPEDWFGKVDPYYLPQLKAAIQSHIDGETERMEYKYQIRSEAGLGTWVLSRGVVSRDADGRAVSIAGSMTNIAHVIEVEQRLVKDALEDKLTGLANRNHLTSHLEAIASRSRNRYEEVGLVFIDLDDFKLVNDSLGHLMGDRLLAEVAARLRRCKLPGHMLARFAGDEFVFLIENLSSRDEPMRVCQKVQQMLLQPFQLGSYEMSLTASMGICIGRAGVDRHEDLIRNADIAMFAAKSDGKGQIRTFLPEMLGETVRSWALKNEVKDIVAKKAFWIEYQPILSGNTGRIVGAEALLRFPRKHYHSPSVEQFVHTAEEIGLIMNVGDWVLREACAAAARWQQGKARGTVVSVNVSPHQLVSPDFPETVSRVLEETHLPSHCLELEVTESALITNLELAKTTLERIVATGVRVSIDDFGTGYSSLHHLGNFPFATVKIDRSFVSNLAHDSRARALAVGIVSMAHGLGMEVTAEGIETADQLAYLRSVGCDRVQGYLASRPVPEKKLRDLLACEEGDSDLLIEVNPRIEDRRDDDRFLAFDRQLPLLQNALSSAGVGVPMAFPNDLDHAGITHNARHDKSTE